MIKRNSEGGFTFVELLLVLSIVMIIAAFSYYSYQPYHEKRQLNAFMEQLEKDILFAQMRAMSRKQITVVEFPNGYYRIRNGLNEPMILERYYNENITIQFQNSEMGKTIKFNGNGNIQKTGKIEISYKSKKYTVVFQLGKGRFYYYE